MPHVTWEIHAADFLSSHAGVWDKFIASHGYPPFLASDFLVPAIEGLADVPPYVALAREAGELVAVALVQKAGFGRWQTFQPSQLPLGAWAMSPGSDWNRLLTTLLSALPGFAISISVTQQDPRLQARPAAEPKLETLDYVPTAWIDVAGSFEDFWQARGKNLRQNLKKQRRKLEEHGGGIRCEIVDQPEEVERAFAQFAALESVGWKADAGSAISADNPQGRFYRKMLSRFGARGAAFAIRLSAGDKVVAVDFGIGDPNSVVLLKTTYDESLKGFSPGQLLHESAFEQFFTRGAVKRIEFYGRVMEWHTRWSDKACTLFHINFFRWPIVSRLRALTQKRVSESSKTEATD